jgi:hypothetical protein
MWKNWKPYALMAECKMVPPQWKTVWWNYHVIHTSSSGDVPERKAENEQMFTHHVQSSTDHHSPGRSSKRTLTDENKQNVAYTLNGVLFNLKKEGNSDTCHSTDEPGVHP